MPFVFHTNSVIGLKYFCKLIGDYESILMLLDTPTKPIVPSMNPVTIALFVRFKRQKKGDVLRNDGGSIVKDVLGNEVECQGGWKDPRNVDQLFAAISSIHEVRNQLGQFQEKCDECFALDAQQQYHGCSIHRGSPALWTKGDPKHSSHLKNALRGNSKMGRDYQARGDNPLAPFEMVKIKNACVATNKLCDFQFWVMTIIGIRLALREDELCDLKLTDSNGINCINWDLTTISPGGLPSGIGFNIKGKSDSTIVRLQLWAADDVPSSCPVRHLFAWLFLTGIRSGYLFPSYRSLEKLKENVYHVREKISNATYMDRYKHFADAHITREAKIGTHSNRKTYYLEGVFSKAEHGALTAGARHKSLANAAKYVQDSGFMLAMAERNGKIYDGVVPKWKPIYCKDIQLAMSFQADTVKEQNLPSLAGKLAASLGLRNPGKHTVFEVVDSLENVKRVGTAAENLEKIIAKVSPDLQNELRTSIGAYMAEMAFECRVKGGVKRLRETSSAEQENNAIDSFILPVKSGPKTSANLSGLLLLKPEIIEETDNASKTKKRGGNNDLEKRHQIKKTKDTKNKLIIMKNIHVPLDRTSLSEGARNFVILQLEPVLGCLKSHFNENLERFVEVVNERWKGSFYPSKFKKECCGGTGTECGMINNENENENV